MQLLGRSRVEVGFRSAARSCSSARVRVPIKDARIAEVRQFDDVLWIHRFRFGG